MAKKKRAAPRTRDAASFRSPTGGIRPTVERPFERVTDVIGFSRWLTTSIYPSTTASIPTVWVFKLNQLPGYTEVTSMYDQYRITQVDVIYEPASRAGPSTATGTAGAPHLLVRVNFDGGNSASYDQMREYDNTRVYSAYQRWEHRFTPKISMMAYNGATSTGYSVAQGSPWVSTSNADVEYYGLQFAFPQVTGTTQFGGTLLFHVHVEAKNVL